ncbi:LytR/AlgR family response regulator transcription factor [Marinigracilibium pacificum]|uniref:Response regulator transcription factor n=1 Tax=Marinigracilibium pacificum TaxID=2729599 RepID=A0A848IVR8_9BACT|nr:LytTR family DNA-binding domain-containing protein [Marinigracilibium pacificum]NMM48583.1 response regulator transcription factor [Marinigracilibium pacificum]
MNVIIIEDEKPAAKRLENLLVSINPDIRVLEKLTSVKDAVEFLQNGNNYDVIFLDIQLSDGLSFEIFDHIKVNTPIIFTTAYNEYALKAFEVNSIDYLLKPIDEDDIEKALNKLEGLKSSFQGSQNIPDIAATMRKLTKSYKNRFLIKIGEHYKSVAVSDIEYFYSKEKATFCNTNDNKNLLLDHSLESLESMLDPDIFFRVNRKFIIRLSSIQDIIIYSNSRLKLIIRNHPDEEIIVSREKVNTFKSILDQ